jgi:tetratricopeptide (TPR) repeat protein
MGPSTRIDALRRRIETDPASIAFAQLAEEYRRAGQLAEAVETCRAGLLTHPDYSSARVTLGRALLALGRLDDAAAELQRVVDAVPGNLAARRALAEACRRQGRTREALEHFTAARALAPHEPDLERITTDLSRALATQAPDAEPAAGRHDAATLAALEQWLEAIHAVRADRDA